MDEAPCAPLPDDLPVRALRDQVQRPGFRVQTSTVVTTRVHAERYGVAAWSARYVARWGMATHVAHVQTTMDLDVLKGKPVDGVLTARLGVAFTSNVVRLVMGHAARRQHVGIDRSRCIDAARWLAAARDDASLPTLGVNPRRPYRDAPRVRTRRPKPSPRMKNARQEIRQSLAIHVETD
jgi:hypothetical protein